MERPTFHDELNEIRRRAGLGEARMIKVWHVTEKRKVPQILRRRLEPRIGHSSRRAGEKKPLIYVFTDETSMEEAVMNWLGDETAHRQSVLELTVPENWVTQDPVGWEAHIEHPVPPEMIKIAIADLDESSGELNEIRRRAGCP